MHQNRAVPAPIFNARKRPRQAVIAEPQMTQMGPGPAGAPSYSGLMPPGGFGNPGQQQHSMSGRGDANQSGASFRENKNSNRQWTPNRAQSYGNSGACTGKRNIQTTAAPMRFSSNQQCTSAPTQTNYSGNQPCPRVQATGSPYGQTRTFNFNKQNRLDQAPRMPGNKNARGMTGYGASGSTPGISMYGNTTRLKSFAVGGYYQMDSTSQHAANVIGQYTPAFANSTDDFDDDLNDSMNFVPTQMLSNNNTVINSAKKKAKNTNAQTTAHILTVRAAGIRRWAKYRETLHLIFEVFGYLDSAMGRGQGGCREFLLRDDAKDPINCIFYEIDRQLAKMTRGQWYRVVGTYDQKNDQLKCVSIRPMADTERPMVQMLVDRSSQELARLTRQMREQ